MYNFLKIFTLLSINYLMELLHNWRLNFIIQFKHLNLIQTHWLNSKKPRTRKSINTLLIHSSRVGDEIYYCPEFWYEQKYEGPSLFSGGCKSFQFQYRNQTMKNKSCYSITRNVASANLIRHSILFRDIFYSKSCSGKSENVMWFKQTFF